MRSKNYKERDTKTMNGKEKDYSRKKKSRRSSKMKEDQANLDSRGRDNDPNWYFTSNELAQQSAELSFQSVLGFQGYEGFEIPTIAKVYLNPNPGRTKVIHQYNMEFTDSNAGDGYLDLTNGEYAPSYPEEQTGINVMAQKLYTLLSSFSGRTSNYQPADVAMMLLAISSVAELSEYLRRAFGVALTYNYRNRTMPKVLIDTMGIDADDLFSNVADYRMRFNTLISRINQIPLLDNIGFIRKCRDIYQKVYTDEASAMAQLFFYAPASTWIIDETSDPNGTCLMSSDMRVTTAPIPMSQYLLRMENMITALLNSYTMNLVYADLLNMANKIKTPTWQFDYLAENYIVMPEYNRTMSLQFHNSNIVGYPVVFTGGGTPAAIRTTAGPYNDEFTSGNCVVSDSANNKIVYNPVWNSNLWLQSAGKVRPVQLPNTSIIDMDVDSPDIVDRIEALRYSSIWSGWYMLSNADIGSSLPALSYGMACGDHYVTNIVIYRNDVTQCSNFNKPSMLDNILELESANLFRFFNKYPVMDLIDLPSTPPDKVVHLLQVLGDLNFYTSIDYRYLDRINDLMNVGLFDFRA